MSAVAPWPQVAWLLAALPAGLLLVRGLPPAASHVARAGTATLAGLGFVAAVAHALHAIGLPARQAAWGVAGLSIAFAVRAAWRRDPRPARPPGAGAWIASVAREVLPLACVAALLWQPVRHVRDFPLDAHDGIHIWAPKAMRAFTDVQPDLETHAGNAHPEYPRGLAILTAAIASPAERFDARLPRAVPLVLFALLLLCACDALASAGRFAAGLCAAVVLGALPQAAYFAASGLADVPLAAFILLGSFALGPGASGRPAAGALLAAALGAMAIKDEGLPAAAFLLAAGAWRFARLGRPASAFFLPLAAAVVATPWLVLRALADSGSPLLWRATWQNLGLTLQRIDALVRESAHVAFGLPDPSPNSFELPGFVAGGDAIFWTALACAVVLLAARGGRRVAILPALALLAIDGAVIVMSPVAMDWQVVTALVRLVLQVLPVLVVGAIDAITTQDRAGAAAGDRTPAPA